MLMDGADGSVLFFDITGGTVPYGDGRRLQVCRFGTLTVDDVTGNDDYVPVAPVEGIRDGHARLQADSR